MCPIWPVRDLNLRPPAPETNALPLNQLAGNIDSQKIKFVNNVVYLGVSISWYWLVMILISQDKWVYCAANKL